MRLRKRPGVVVLLVLIALAGFASTLALGSASGGILPTLTAPTLPISLPVTTAPLPPAPPLPPLPPPPPLLPPAPPPPALPPAPPLPSAPPLLHGSAPPSTAPVTAAAGAAGSSGSSSSAGPAPSLVSQPSSRSAANAPRVSHTRFHTRGPGRRGTTITFHLTAPASVVLLVRGPSPSCEVAGRRVVSLGKGVSRVRFLGRFHGRPLAPGTYGITMVARRGLTSTMLGRLAIAVVPPGERVHRSAARPVFDDCAAAAGSSGSSQLFTGLGLVLPTAARKVAATPKVISPRASFRPPRLSVPVPRAPQLPGVPGGGPVWLGFLVYAVAMLAGAAMLLLVVSFAKQRWNP